MIPSKSQKGVNLRQWLVTTVDALIDCIIRLRICAGPGISVRETPAGTIVSVIASNARPRQSANPGMVRAGEGIRIDNGTASSVYVPGGTATAVPVNGATFTCTVGGGTSSPGGGIDFPDWGMSDHNTGADGVTDIGNADLELAPNAPGIVLSSNAWIYAFAEFASGTVNEARASAHVVVNGASFKVASIYSYPVDDSSTGTGGGIVIPVLSGATVSFAVQIGQNPADFVHREGCVVYYV